MERGRGKTPKRKVWRWRFGFTLTFPCRKKNAVSWRSEKVCVCAVSLILWKRARMLSRVSGYVGGEEKRREEKIKKISVSSPN